jgi:lipoprotein-anchoring transpeptidase ErfK/SrfK
VVARRSTLAVLGAAACVLVLSSCGADAGVRTGSASASGTHAPPEASTDAPTTTEAPSTTAEAPSTTAEAVRPVSETIPAPSTTPPPTTMPPPPTCAASEVLTAGVCVAVPEPTTLPPPAPPEPSPPLLVAVAPAKPGARGDNVKALQQRLLDLGFWVDAVDGKYGHTTMQAVMAFQKYYGLAPTASVDYHTAEFINTSPMRVRATADRGTLIEVDKAKQVLFVVQDGRTLWAVNTSTGSGKTYSEQGVKDPEKTFDGVAVTPVGWFKVNRQHDEGWWEGDLGQIYRPKYFRGGIAVHGMKNIPNHPVSHGCVRVSVPFMDYVWAQNLMPMGMAVWVHV